MPKVYSTHHDEFLKRFNPDEENNEILGKKRLLFAKHKSDYIFPIYLNIQVKYLKNTD